MFESWYCTELNDSVELLLYHFDINPGDTLESINFYTCGSKMLDRYDSTIIFGKRIKTYEFIVFGENYDFYWYEGIGSSQGILFPIYLPFEIWWDLICFGGDDDDWSSLSCLTDIETKENKKLKN